MQKIKNKPNYGFIFPTAAFYVANNFIGNALEKRWARSPNDVKGANMGAPHGSCIYFLCLSFIML